MHSDYIFKPSRPARRAFMTRQSTSYTWTTALMKWASLSLRCALVFAACGPGPQVSTRVVRAFGLEHTFTGKGIEHADCNTGGGHRCTTEPWQLTAGMHASLPYFCLYIQSLGCGQGHDQMKCAGMHSADRPGMHSVLERLQEPGVGAPRRHVGRNNPSNRV